MASDLWYYFALQQVIAESYWDNVDLTQRQARINTLMLGNNRPGAPETWLTRLTQAQAEYVADRYHIVDHHPNFSSGFSGTLIFDTDRHEYTLAMRSTEYKLQRDGGDFERDALGADKEIGDYGFAFAQIASMERYFENLLSGRRADGIQDERIAPFRAHIEAGGLINLTGFSLSGHLATVFAELHPEYVNAAYLFNSPGRGRLPIAPVGPMIAHYRIQAELFQNQFPPNITTNSIYNQTYHQLAVKHTAASFGLYGKMTYSMTGLPPDADAKLTHIYGRATHGDREFELRCSRIQQGSNLH
jgi:pimeloyl-ACP methyl ester carboxylesterase